MFAKLFSKTFIITSNIPSEIKSNYKIKELHSTNIYNCLKELYNIDCTTKDFVFCAISDNKLFNPILQQYCCYLGFDYDIYKCIMDYNDFYNKSVVKVYEPLFKEDNICLIDKRRFSVIPQSIPWNYGNLPFEYWVNHYKTDSYARKLYKKLFKFEYNTDNEFYNMSFDSEFDCILFNFRLMKLLQKRKFILQGIQSNITIDDINKESKLEDLNFDNKSIYIRDNIYPKIKSIEILKLKEDFKNDSKFI